MQSNYAPNPVFGHFLPHSGNSRVECDTTRVISIWTTPSGGRKLPIIVSSNHSVEKRSCLRKQRRNHSPVLIFRPVGGRALVRFLKIAEKASGCRSELQSLAESPPWDLKRLLPEIRPGIVKRQSLAGLSRFSSRGLEQQQELGHFRTRLRSSPSCHMTNARHRRVHQAR